MHIQLHMNTMSLQYFLKVSAFYINWVLICIVNFCDLTVLVPAKSDIIVHAAIGKSVLQTICAGVWQVFCQPILFSARWKCNSFRYHLYIIINSDVLVIYIINILWSRQLLDVKINFNIFPFSWVTFTIKCKFLMHPTNTVNYISFESWSSFLFNMFKEFLFLGQLMSYLHIKLVFLVSSTALSLFIV